MKRYGRWDQDRSSSHKAIGTNELFKTSLQGVCKLMTSAVVVVEHVIALS